MDLETIRNLSAIASSLVVGGAALFGLRWLLKPRLNIEYDVVSSLDETGWIEVRIYNNRPNLVVIDGCWLVAERPDGESIYQQAVLGFDGGSRDQDRYEGAGVAEIAANGILRCFILNDFSNAALIRDTEKAEAANEIENIKKRATFFDQQERPSCPRRIEVSGKRFVCRKPLPQADVLELPIGSSLAFLREMADE